MKKSLGSVVIVIAGLIFAVMVIYPMTMLVLGSMALPNIIIGVIFCSLMLAVDGFLVYIYIVE